MTKFCRDCYWHEEWEDGQHKCMAPTAPRREDLVTGATTYPTCHDVRGLDDLCGRVGQWWLNKS